jgi:hypothetical protein
VDKDGKNVSPELLKKRMKEHITTVVKRYKGRIKGWDVVNEAFEDNGSYRKTKFYEKSIFLWLSSMHTKPTRTPNYTTTTIQWLFREEGQLL